jgi:hypothetical protein
MSNRISSPVCRQHEYVTLVSSGGPPCRIVVECSHCGAIGTVENYTQDEWYAAGTAYRAPAPWTDNGRVIPQPGHTCETFLRSDPQSN